MQSTSAAALLRLSDALLGGIEETVLKCDGPEFKSALEELRRDLNTDLDLEKAASIEESAARILARHIALAQQKSATHAVEIQHVIGMLHQALLVLAGGSERSLSRLQQIHQSLQATSRMQDVAGLRASLAETMRFISEETKREQERAEKERGELQEDFGRIRAHAGVSEAALPGRPEGVRHIDSEFGAIAPGSALYLVAFRFERLQAIIQRYGPEAADALLFRVVSDRVHPLAATGLSFRWNANSLVAVFQRARDMAKVVAEAAALNRAPLVHRMLLGNRTATLTVNPSHLVVEGGESGPEPVIAEVDQFTLAA
ncbi:MAG TPA: hypothetical protein VFA04_01980 [Bryobacteraceae bacterium]|nr:hypothetical protein [Bryobacteraceae bacterium]